MFTIQKLNAISNIIFDVLPSKDYQLSDTVDNPDAILVRSAKCHDMTFGSNLRAIARAGAGVNNIPVDRCSEKGIVVFNTPGANANAVKELLLSGMLFASRNLLPASQWVYSLRGKGDEMNTLIEREKKQFVGHELSGKTLGVVGLGAIGVLVANQGYALDMNIIGYDPYISIDHAWRLSRAVTQSTDLCDMLGQCDFVSVHIPLMEQTHHFIDEKAISAMKPGAVLLNFARGELVDDDAVIAALRSKRLSCYVCDFPTDQLLAEPNVICLPHLGASTTESEENCAEMAASELRDFLENGNIINSVNLPDCALPRSSQGRVCIIHRNTPNMISQFTSLLSQRGLNIANLLNKSRGNYAYTIIDLDDHTSSNDLNAISDINGVIRYTVFE